MSKLVGYKCDRCGKIVNEDDPNSVIYSVRKVCRNQIPGFAPVSARHLYKPDLCNECLQEFLKFMNAKGEYSEYDCAISELALLTK